MIPANQAVQLARTLFKSWQVAQFLGPWLPARCPDMNGGFKPGRIVERSSFQHQELWVRVHLGHDRGATIRTKFARQFVSAVRSHGKTAEVASHLNARRSYDDDG